MLIEDVIKQLSDFRDKNGNVKCVAFTLDHGPFDLGCTCIPEDGQNKAHVQFGAEETDEDLDSQIYKLDEDGEDEENENL